MSRRPRSGVSTYIEVFVLIGVAMAGSGVVFEAGMNAAASLRGASLSLSDASIRQGSYFAVESVVVFNSGSTPLGALVLSTEGVSASSTYCYSVYDPGGGPLTSTCPATIAGPATVSLAAALDSGRGVLVVLTLTGNAFRVGESCRITVTSASGAQGSADVEVAPA